MEVESVDAQNQQQQENEEFENFASRENSDVDILTAAEDNDNDANDSMTLHVEWIDEDTTTDSVKNSNQQEFIVSMDEEEEEDVKKYYIMDVFNEEDQNEELAENSAGSKSESGITRKRRASSLSDEEFYGFDEEPLEVLESKFIHKKVKEQSVSSEKEQKDTNEKERTKLSKVEDTNSLRLSVEDSLKKENTGKKLISPVNNETKSSAKILDELIQTKGSEMKNGNKMKISQGDQHQQSPVRQGSKITPIRNSIYRKPFDMGWKREIVYRAFPSSSKDKGEAYYITPQGKKLRTKGEIVQHLSPGLNIEMFTFSREPLGYGPDEEIIRSAKVKSDSTPSNKRVSTTDNNLGKRVPKPKVPKGASPPPQNWTQSKSVKTTPVVSSPRTTAQTKNQNLEDIENKNKSTPKTGKQTKKTAQADISNVTLTTGENAPIRKKNLNSRSKTVDIPQTTNQQSTISHRSPFDSFTLNFFGNVSLGYDILLQTFEYLKVQELLKAACVCRMWNLIANHRSLWKTVRMKNSQINDWTTLIGVLRRNETKHLDLRKMIISNTNSEGMWESFSKNIHNVTSLEAIDLCRCSSKIVEGLFLSNPNLKILNAFSIKDQTLNLENLNQLQNLEELRLKSVENITLTGDLTSIKNLQNLKHLSLTSIEKLGMKEISALGELINLESLELGECTNFDSNFIENVLKKLTKLERLRLEDGKEPCCILEILDEISKMKTLTQLELVNFDVRIGFDAKLSQCKNLKKLLLIPTYVSQSATTNNIILKALLNLSDTLRTLTWVVTLELLRVTALYVVQCDDKKKDNREFGESIPVLKPVPGVFSDGNNSIDRTPKTTSTPTDVPQVEILPLTKVERILSTGLPDTKLKILKVPFHATWRQNLIENQ